MTEKFPFRSWFMVVLEGNVHVGAGKRRRMKPTIVRSMYYVDGSEEVEHCPAQLLTQAEQQFATQHGGNRFVAVNAFRVLVSEKDVSNAGDSDSDDSGEEE